MRVLVIGGTLFIGKLLVKKLIAGGHEVTILHRKAEHPFGRKVKNLIADRNDVVSLKAAFGGHRFDAVYDIAYDWERGTTPQQVEATAKAVPGEISRYIFMSSVAAYGDGLNHAEDDPLASDMHQNEYVRNKAGSERALFRMYHESRFPVVTMRPPFVYGPDNPMYRESFFWDRLALDRPIIIPGDGNRLMQFVYVNDLADACFNALTKHTAPGRAFNVADDKPLTQVEAVSEFAKVLGKVPHLVRVPRDIIARNGGNAMKPPYYFAEYYDLPPITEAVGRVRRVLNITMTPFQAGLRETYKWYTKHAEGKKVDFSFEDKLIKQAKEVVRPAHIL
ncbi:MAG: NAD-dependent epimerase/dehydratase family protein [Acidobacteriota bacterium]|nr:NAD-dependent epimerase/dehydratase family protein [Acidobacteriota bacterium]